MLDGRAIGEYALGELPTAAGGTFRPHLAVRRSQIIGVMQMYPRNAVSPERIAVGQVILIADGTIQTSAVVITVRPQAGAEATGGGTTVYGAEGTVYYTPTQAETNYTSFTIIASKAACFSASQTIITSASAVAGNVVLSAETHTGAVIPTVSALTNLPTIPTNWITPAGISASALDGKGDWNIGKTGYVLTQAFPANFADLAIALTTGVVTVGTNNDKTGYTLTVTPPTAAAIRSEVDLNSTQLAAIIAYVDELETRLSAIRAGYLDNLSAGAVAQASSLAVAQADLDILTGTNGVTLASSQPNYAPAKAGDNMGLTATATSAQLISDIFNEVLSKAKYNTGQSLGKMIREIGAWTAAEGTVSGVPTTTSVTTNITGFDDNFFRDQCLFAYNGSAQAGQGRIVSTYNGTTGEFTFDEAFTTALVAGDDVVIVASHVHRISQIQSGLATEAKQDATDIVIAELTTQGDTNESKLDAAALINTEARMSELDAATAGKMANQVDIIQTDTTTDIPALIASAQTAIDAIQTDLSNGTDGLGALKALIDAVNTAITSTGAVLTVTERNAIADAILDRDMSTGADSGSPTVRTVRQSLRANRNKVSIAGGVMTITKEDDVTASWTATVVTTAGDPISSLDPA
ncbi:MAG: hypothetical protein OEM38_00380 [Gammaproteobacteria bacterium]|nr:hypothetical protein [Gammaproteobacteria bacterium]